MINPNDSTFPIPPSTILANGTWAEATSGIPVRAHFAAMAMQGILASGSTSTDSNIASYAVAAADALIAELNKGNP